jgi:NhaP-type Na+/H+ or K+/H+ antiporter
MEIGFGNALLVVGLLLTVAAALSGVMRGTVLSISVLAVALGMVLALTDVVSIDAGDESIVHVITIALLLTLFSDGLVVEGELLARHWGPPARALAVAMPITLVLLAVGAHTLFPGIGWIEAFLLGAVLAPTDPVVTSAVVTSQRVPAVVRHTLNLESGLNDGLALPIVLFFLAAATPGVGAGSEGARVLGEAAFGAVLGVIFGVIGGRLHHHLPGGGITRRYEGLYAIGVGLAAYGVADVTFGNGLIAAFVTGIVLGAAEHDIPRKFIDFSDNVSAVFQVLTFFIFGALIVATGYHQSIWRLAVFVPFALLVARPAAVLLSLAGTRLPRVQRLFIAWFGPKGVASVLFALLVLDRGVQHGRLIFDVAAFVVLSSIVSHGLTDTVGSKWIEQRMRRRADA